MLSVAVEITPRLSPQPGVLLLQPEAKSPEVAIEEAIKIAKSFFISQEFIKFTLQRYNFFFDFANFFVSLYP